MDFDILISYPIKGANGFFCRVSVQDKERYAECIVPGAKIEKNNGFTQDELKQVTAYLKEHEAEIIEKSKQINPIKNWLGL